MLRVAFTIGPEHVELDQTFTATLQLYHYPYSSYDALAPGTVFRLHEGPPIVGYGQVISAPRHLRPWRELVWKLFPDRASLYAGEDETVWSVLFDLHNEVVHAHEANDVDRLTKVY